MSEVFDERADVHTMFSLSYANMLVLPRSILQSMPEKWQKDFVAMVDELHHTFEGSPDYEEPAGYRVQPTDEYGKLIPWHAVKVPHYWRGRTKVRPGPWAAPKPNERKGE